MRFAVLPALGERVPDESTVRKLTRRLGAESVKELTRSLIEMALGERRFRPRAVRIDSTVIEADVRYPTDAGLAWHGVRALAREARKLATLVKEERARRRAPVPHDGEHHDSMRPRERQPVARRAARTQMATTWEQLLLAEIRH